MVRTRNDNKIFYYQFSMSRYQKINPVPIEMCLYVKSYENENDTERIEDVTVFDRDWELIALISILKSNQYVV